MSASACTGSIPGSFILSVCLGGAYGGVVASPVGLVVTRYLLQWAVGFQWQWRRHKLFALQAEVAVQVLS